jgi:hypothetical protein
MRCAGAVRTVPLVGKGWVPSVAQMPEEPVGSNTSPETSRANSEPRATRRRWLRGALIGLVVGWVVGLVVVRPGPDDLLAVALDLVSTLPSIEMEHRTEGWLSGCVHLLGTS